MRIGWAILFCTTFVTALVHTDSAGAADANSPKASEPAWEQFREVDGIKVFRRDVPGTDIVAFRGETIIEAPLPKLLWVFADNDHRTEWVDRLEKSVLLERVSGHEVVLYQAFGLPPLISNRDYVYRAKMFREVGSKTIRVHMASEEHPKAPPTIGVRAQLVNSAYLLTPLGPNKTQVAVEILTDPKGSVPIWLVNLIQKSWPVKTLNGIREQVQKPYIQSYPPPPYSEALPVADTTTDTATSAI